MPTRHTLPVFLIAWSLLSLTASAADWRQPLQPMFEQHCIDCHDADAKKGGLDLQALSWRPDDAENFQQWTKVFDKVRHGEMPPRKKERPAAETLKSFLGTLHDEMHRVSAERQSREGRTVLRRLNRSEYENTVHALLGVDTPLRDLLPEDATAEGFDNVGAALELSAVHLEQYLQAADKALREAVVSKAKPEVTTEKHDYEATEKAYHHFYTQFGRTEDGRLGIRFTGQISIGELPWKGPVVEGHYRVRIRAQGFIDKHGPAAKPADKNRPERRVIMNVGIKTGRTGSLEHLAFVELPHDAMREVELIARIPVGKSIYLAPYRAVPELPDERAMVTGVCIAVESVTIEGPLFEEWPSRGHKLLFGELPLVPADARKPNENLHAVSPQADADARRLVRAFLPKIFRRPVSEADAEDFVALALDELKQGRPFDEAIIAACKMALCSPQFLFLQEKPGRLDDHALAARLSYFLWSAPPDDELLALAAQKKLGDSATLRAQTERMLASPRAAAFTRNFLASWLNLRDIDFTQPDTKLYPEFEDYLRDSMMRETHAFFDEMLRHDLSVRNFIHSDFAMLNERLAEHYGIGGVKGDDIRKVTLPPDSRRGGILTQGAILKVSANGTTTSPVVRGAYVLDRILGTPPDPPPKDVPSIEPDIRGATTIREQLEKHRSQTQCAGCHAKLDPPGFALESYDVTGRWRANYRAIPDSAKDKIVGTPGSDVRYYITGPAVNPAYQLADGRAFKDMAEFQNLLLTQSDQVARCVTEKLLTYATGARIQFADRDVIEAIVQRSKQTNHGLRSLVHEIVQSQPFLQK